MALVRMMMLMRITRSRCCLAEVECGKRIHEQQYRERLRIAVHPALVEELFLRVGGHAAKRRRRHEEWRLRRTWRSILARDHG